jgi:glycosyltransferase involved in cell wall biosynthesis
MDAASRYAQLWGRCVPLARWVSVHEHGCAFAAGDPRPQFPAQSFRHSCAPQCVPQSEFPALCKESCTRIATVSEFSKQDIVQQYGIAPEKIDVVYNGVSERFGPTSVSEQVAARQRWTNGAPYFIYVGAMHPRKNIARMLKAFDGFRASVSEPVKLVMVGNRQWWTAEMEAALQQMTHKDDVVFAGRVAEEELQQLLGAAFASLYVSTFEGFGIPIIEAFQAEVPVITSNVTAMPEVAGDGALLVDPFDEASITAAMVQLWGDGPLRANLLPRESTKQRNSRGSAVRNCFGSRCYR